MPGRLIKTITDVANTVISDLMKDKPPTTKSNRKMGAKKKMGSTMKTGSKRKMGSARRSGPVSPNVVSGSKMYGSYTPKPGVPTDISDIMRKVSMGFSLTPQEARDINNYRLSKRF